VNCRSNYRSTKT